MENLFLNQIGVELFGFFGLNGLEGEDDVFYISDNQMFGYLQATEKALDYSKIKQKRNLQYAMKYFNTPYRNEALKKLSEQDTTSENFGFFGLLSYMYEPESLGKLKIGKKLKNAVKTAVTKTGQAVKTAATKTGQAAKKGLEVAKKTLIVLNKFNPVTIALRNALRGLIELNFIGMASAMKSDAKLKAKVQKMFVNMGGDVSIINGTIENGAKRKPLLGKDAKKFEEDTTPATEDLDGLGAVAATGLLVTAGAFVLKIWNWMKQSGFKIAKTAQELVQKGKELIGKKDKTENIDNSENEVDSDKSENISVLPPINKNEDEIKKKRRRLILIGGIAFTGVAGYGLYRYMNKKKQRSNPLIKSNIQQLNAIKLS